MKYDVLLKNCLIVDGNNTPAFRGDVAVSGDSIVEISSLITAEADKVYDLKGLCVSPGFIDIHSHSELTLFANPQGESKLYQGVTTEVVGNCGLTAFPLATDERRASLKFMDVPGLDWTWTNTEEYLNTIRSKATSINTVPQVGHGSIRAQVMGYEKRKASDSEIKQMQNLLRDCFERGIYGLSVGLGYAPDFYSDEDELVAFADVVKGYDRFFSFHPRGERDTYFKAIAEVVSIARRSGANCEISHLKCAHVSNVGKMRQVLDMIEAGRREGLNIHFDHYPYTAGNSYLGLMFPPYAHEGGPTAFLARLADSDTREKIKKDMMTGTDTWSSFLFSENGRNIMISNMPDSCKGYVGKNVEQIAIEHNTDPAEMCCRLMEESNATVDIIMFQQKDSDLEMAMQAEYGTFGSDGFAMDMGNVIKKGRPHPRSFGTFPRILGHYVREKNILTLEEAVHKMTYASACKIGLANRGLLAKGFKADIVAFDPATVRDTATYENPFSYAEGINLVMVNGKVEFENGKPNGVIAGKVLLKGKNE